MMIVEHFKFCYLFSADFARLCPMGIGHGDQGEDLNECALIPNLCQGGECINTDGSFRCECTSGYVLDATGQRCIGKTFHFFKISTRFVFRRLCS